jgi:menaquinone-dependent protoporphyrinogen oxidase
MGPAADVDMRVLVTWGSKRGGTEGIGRILAESLRQHGVEVVAVSAGQVGSLDTFDAAIVGGALYANRWPWSVRHFVMHHLRRLRAIPVWFFSSGPLDASADGQDIAPTSQVAVLAERVGAKGHVTFGGRLQADAKGFPAGAMAKTKSGDWRNPDRIRAWAGEIAAVLPTAAPGKAVDHPAGSVWRLAAHALVGWAISLAALVVFLYFVRPTSAVVGRAIASPLLFTAMAWHYFRERGARDPLPTAAACTLMVAALDLAVITGALPFVLGPLAVIAECASLALILMSIWITGLALSMIPRSGHRLPSV